MATYSGPAYTVRAWIDTPTHKRGDIITRGTLAHVAGYMAAFSCGNREACRAFLRSGKTYTAAPLIAARER